MTRKKYVVYESTLDEVFKLADIKRDPNSPIIELYKYENKVEMDEAQKQTQYQNSWQSHIDLDLTLYNNELEQEIEKTMFDMVLSKSKENIEKATLNKMMDTKISACIEIVDKPNGHQRVDRSIEMEFTREKERNDNVEYVYDTKEMEDAVKNVKMDKSFSSNSDEFVYVDNIAVRIYEYRLDRMKDVIPKIIKRIVRKNLTYCLKKGVCIIPDEYLDKGLRGIEEWKDMKSSSNKNNSMEKRMMKQLLHDKKFFARDCVYSVTRAIADTHHSWKIPVLEVDGRWNKTRIQSLVTQMFKDKTNQEIMSMENEKILELFKDYWKKELMNAYNAVDKCKVEDK